MKKVPIEKRIGLILLELLYLFAIIGNLYLAKTNESIRNVFFLLAELVLFLVCFYYIFILKIFKNSRLFRHNIIYYLFASLLIIVQLYCHNLDRESYIRVLAYAINGFLLYVVLGQVLYFDQYLFDNFTKAISFCCAFLGLTAIAANLGTNSFFGLPFSEKYYYGVFGLHGTGGILEHPNTLGTEMLFGIGCSYYAFVKERKVIFKIVYIVLLALCASGLILNFHRGPWLAFFVGLIGVVFIRPEASRKKIIAFYSFAVLLVLLVSNALYSLAQHSDLLYRLLRISQHMSGRSVNWDIALDLIPKQPFAGYGFFESTYLLWRYSPQKYQTSGFHNTFLDMAIFSGVIVACLYLYLFVMPHIRVMLSAQKNEMIRLLLFLTMAILVSIFFVGYNIGGLRSTSILIAVFLGVAYNSGRAKRKAIFEKK